MKTNNTFLFLLISTFIFSQTNLEKKSILIKNDSIELPGTLTQPYTSKKLIIWIHGSGNVDRNGNQAGINVKANYIQQFREAINKEGIAFYSFDKRTANPKNKPFLKETLFDDFVADVTLVINHFKKDTSFDEIILIGHSQGSLIGMLVSNLVDKYISLAGPSETIDATIIKQLATQNPTLATAAKNHFKELKETGEIKNVNPFLASIFAKQNLPFLKNWMQYNPINQIKKIQIPTLIINGTKDLQVKVEEAKALKKTKPNAQLVVIKNMNHVLKHIEKDEDNLASYYSDTFLLSKELVNAITQFVKQ